MPPPSVSPAIPTVGQEPPGKARPWAAELVIDIDQLRSGADSGEIGAGFDAHLVHRADIDQQSRPGGPARIMMTAGPHMNRNAAPAGKIDTSLHIPRRPAARHGHGTDMVEARLVKLAGIFERERRRAAEALPPARLAGWTSFRHRAQRRRPPGAPPGRR